MASVVIAGNTSGSVTLDAPAVAGTTVLTLPATSGTVVTTATTTGISGSAITTGTVGISVGGTGATTATAAFNALNPMTTTGDILYESSPTVAARLPIGSTNQVLTVVGGLPAWAAAGGGQFQTEIFTSPGTWTKPASATQVRVTVVGGGGSAYIQNGGYGGLGVSANVPVSSPVAVTVGAGAAAQPGGAVVPGGTSSFGSAVSATGGTGGGGSPGTASPGSSTVSSGTALRSAATVVLYTQNPFYGTSIRTSGQGNAAVAYSTSSNNLAGAGGIGGPSAPQFTGGVGGVVIVEYVG
jgi:hypothetical protein